VGSVTDAESVSAPGLNMPLGLHRRLLLGGRQGLAPADPNLVVARLVTFRTAATQIVKVAHDACPV
jgi:hypothetical protein